MASPPLGSMHERANESLLRRVMHAYVSLAFRWPVALLVLFITIGAVAAYVAGTLGFHGDFIELLPENSEEVQSLRFVEQRAGGGGYLVVQLKGGTQQQRRDFALAAAPKLEAQRDVIRYVEHRFDIEFFRQHALWLLPVDRLTSLTDDVEARIRYEKKIRNPLYVDLGEEDDVPASFDAIAKKYESPDAPNSEFIEAKNGEELYLYIKPNGQAGDLTFDRALLKATNATLAEVHAQRPQVAYELTGAYAIREEEDRVMQNDLTSAGLLSFIISLAVILAATRRPVALVVVAAPVLLGVAFTFSFARFWIGYLNPVTGFLGAILVGLGVEYGIHLSMRYWEERENHTSQDAMFETLVGTFGGALTSAATNATAFFVLLLAEFLAFRQFGALAGIGVLMTLLGAYALGPVILVLAEKVRAFKPKLKASDLDAIGANAKPLPSPALAAIIVGLTVFASYSVVVAKHVSFETDLKRLKGDSPATELDDHIAEQLGIIMNPALVYAPDLTSAKKMREAIDEVRAEIGPSSAIQKSASLNDLVPNDVEGHEAQFARLRKVLESLPKAVRDDDKTRERLASFEKMLDAKPYGPDDIPSEIRRRFVALSGGGTFVLIFPRLNGYDVNNLTAWSTELDTVLARAKSKGIDVRLADGNWIAAKIFRLVRQDGFFILGAAAVAVFLMIWLSLRSLSQALLVAGPLFLGMACVFGALHLAGVKLNFLNVVVLPNLLTIAVDNSIHLYHRYKEEGQGSLGHIMRHTGFAALVATLTNATGYATLLIAHHAGLRSIAHLAILGVACTFLGTTVFFPTLLEIIDRRAVRRIRTA